MSSILNCWGACTKPMPESEENKHQENKVTAFPTVSADPTIKHGRVLSTMHIKDGKVVVTHQTITAEEAKQMFRPSAKKIIEPARVIFGDSHKIPSNTEVKRLESAVS